MNIRLLPLAVINWRSIAIALFVERGFNEAQTWDDPTSSTARRKVREREVNSILCIQNSKLTRFDVIVRESENWKWSFYLNRMFNLRNQSFVIFWKWYVIPKPKCFPKLNGKHWDTRKVVRTIRYNPDWYLNFCKKNEIEDKSCV